MPIYMFYYTALLVLLLFTVTCSSNKENADGEVDVVIISTDYGDMKAILYDETPKHKENFIKLVREGFYDSLLFHRVISGFMIQGGDPDSKNAPPNIPLGSGGPGYTIPAEFNPDLFHQKGALAAARLGDQQNPEKESSGSQFYIVQGRVFTQAELDESEVDTQNMYNHFRRLLSDPTQQDIKNEFYQLTDQKAQVDYIFGKKEFMEELYKVDFDKSFSQKQIDAYTSVGGYYPLDGQYTVFGQVVEGLDVIDKIAAVQKGQGDRPVEDVRMTCTLGKIKKSALENE